MIHSIPPPRTLVLVPVILMMLLFGCNSRSDRLRNKANVASENSAPIPPEIHCAAARTDEGVVIIRYHIRNAGTATIHILDGRRMPYQIARDPNTLIVLQGVNPPDPPGALYELPEIPLTRPLASGEVFTGEVALPTKMLRDHHTGLRPTPPTLLHGTIHIRCEAGWGATPITAREHMTMSELFAWQQLTGYGPFDVVLP